VAILCSCMRLPDTVNGFLALKASGGFANRDLGTDLSWQRALDALDTMFRAWPPERNPA
jgi:hypothetical protein